MNPWTWVAAVVGALALVWVGLVAALWVAARREGRVLDLRAVLRLVPDLVRLLHRLARDPRVPRGSRLLLVLLLVYLAMPIDLVPDVIPVVGWADDVVVVALVLRHVVRRAGPACLEQHWPGTADGLAAVRALARVPRDHADTADHPADHPAPEPGAPST